VAVEAAAHLDALMAHEPHTGAPVFSAAPISPQERGETHLERMEQHADLAWLCGRAVIPLTLFAQRTRAATVNAGRIDDAQAAIGFSTLLLGTKLLVCWTAECPAWLESEIVAREAHGMRNQVTTDSVCEPALQAFSSLLPVCR
jgi:hypothetical protein